MKIDDVLLGMLIALGLFFLFAYIFDWFLKKRKKDDR